MSIFSDHDIGYMDDFEYEQECRRMNREDRYEREHEFDDLFEDDETCDDFQEDEE